MLSNYLKSNTLRKLIQFNGATSLSSRHVSTDTGESKVYELRKYILKPDGAEPFLKLFGEKCHLRTKQSDFLGYWRTDLGALNQVIHIWEYDSFAHRTAVRAALANDKEWIEQFIQKAFPFVAQQENSLILKAGWCDLQKDKTKSAGLFELTTYGMKMGGPRVWEEKLKSSLLAHARLDYADLIGVWYTDVGEHNDVQVLWRYDSADARREGRNKAHRDNVVVNKVRDNLENVHRHSSVLMAPLPFSTQ